MLPTYESLSPKERAWMCNGCGPKFGISLDLVPDFIFHEACERHDFDYWLGCSKKDRYQADVRFLHNMLKIARVRKSWRSRVFYSLLALLYYAGVRLLGKSAFSFRQSPATREDLVREMLENP